MLQARLFLKATVQEHDNTWRWAITWSLVIDLDLLPRQNGLHCNNLETPSPQHQKKNQNL